MIRRIGGFVVIFFRDDGNQAAFLKVDLRHGGFCKRQEDRRAATIKRDIENVACAEIMNCRDITDC